MIDDYEHTLRPLWEFLAVAELPRRADVIFVFGSKDFAVPARAAELFHEGHAPRVLVTGSFGRMTRGVFEKEEALVFRDRLIEAGVPTSSIIVEPEASNTLENVRFGMAALRRNGVLPRSALLVAKGFVMRRCVATFTRQCSEVRVQPCPPTSGLVEATDRSRTDFAARLLAEVERLERYAAQGHISPQHVPRGVRQAASLVRRALETPQG